MLMPKKVKFRKQQRGRMRGKAWRGVRRVVRRLRAEGARAVLADRPADRGGARRDDALHQARRQDLGARVSRTSRSPRSRRKRAWARARARPSSGSRVVRPGRVLFEMEGVTRDRSARGDEAGGGEAADPHQVRDPVRAGEDAMKAAELRDLGADELGAKERELADQLFRMRIQKSMGQLEAPGQDARRCAAIWRASRRCCGRSDGVSSRGLRDVSEI